MFKNTTTPVLAILLLLLVAACSPQGPSPFSNDAREQLNDARLTALEIRDQEVAVLSVPSIDLLDCDDAERFIGDVDGVTSDDQYYIALGLLDPADDIVALTDRVIQDTVSIYDLNGNDVMWQPLDCASGEVNDITLREEIVYLDTFIVSMQSRNLNLRGMITTARNNSDRTIASSALSVGDAAYVTEQYLDNRDDLSAEEREAVSIITHVNAGLGDDAADFYRELVTFPHVYGLSFVQALFEEGGWEAVNLAYDYRPRSTEQILHVDRFLAEDEPIELEIETVADLFGVEEGIDLSTMSESIGTSGLNIDGSSNVGGGLGGGAGLGGGEVTQQEEPTATPQPTEAPEGEEEEETNENAQIAIEDLPDQWTLVRDDIMGEFMLRQHMSVYLPEDTVDTAATGWGGDAIEVYYNPGTDERAWLLRIALDTPEDFDEFLTAYEELLGVRTSAEPIETADGSRCWTGNGETVCVNTNVAEFYPADEEDLPAEVVIASAPTTNRSLEMIGVQRVDAGETE